MAAGIMIHKLTKYLVKAVCTQPLHIEVHWEIKKKY